MGEVKLHGFWASLYSCRVIWALQLKGVKYEYIEEDLSNKSELLLQYNPIYKKVPVLVHDGKPVAESRVVLEYIEDTWPDNPLLPQDAYARAMARFWIKFGDDKGLIFHDLFRSTEETKEQAGREVAQVLRTLEEQALGDGKFFGGDSLGLVDIAYGWLAYWFEVMEDVIGIKVLEPSTFPGLWAWTQNFKEVPVIKDNLPDRQQLSNYFKRLRAMFAAESQ